MFNVFMIFSLFRKILLSCVVLLVSTVYGRAQTAKPPVIVIPGLVGSELVNEKTGELVWFKSSRSRSDDLRLPISSEDLSADRDDLVPRDILRRLKIGFGSIDTPYANLINSLKTSGYAEGDWKTAAASSGGAENTFYVFAYDWRRDNVENARVLIEKIERLKSKLNRPDLRFNVVAHSMGGLIARYAAMYGTADLTAGKTAPTWAGAKHFNKIFLVGAPSGGSMHALRTLAAGISPFNLNVNLPFVQNFTRFDFFTVPAVYQLLPGNENLRAFDENLKPIVLDIYDAQTWDKYGWNAANDKNFAINFSRGEQQNARRFFIAALNRARRFHEALAAGDAGKNAPVSIYAVGAQCRDTLDAIIIRRNGDGWKTLFKPEEFRRASDGEIVSAAELNRTMLAPGDGVVTKKSLLAAPHEAEIFQCEGHNDLVANRTIQTNILRLLAND